MTLRVAGGGEERHTSNSRAVGIWTTLAGITLVTTPVYTGSAAYRWPSTAAGAAGGSVQSTYGTKCWWSGAFALPGWVNGTYHEMLNILLDSHSPGGNQRWLGLTSANKIALFSDNAGTILASSTNAFGVTNTFAPWKLELDGNVWTLWADMDDNGSWAQEFTYTDSLTSPYLFKMDASNNTDESKGSVGPTGDDLLMWDSYGGNWNSRIATMSDFPRVSVAHLPDLVSEETAGQATLLNEIPVGADLATATSTGYWASFPTLDGSVTNTIQALMVTAAGETGEPTQLAKFNLRENGTVYLNSANYNAVHVGTDAWSGKVVQQGYDSSLGSPSLTYAGYYPWTPEGNLWTPTNFGACDYGVSLQNGITNQITVQAISFGSAAEWKPRKSLVIPRRQSTLLAM